MVGRKLIGWNKSVLAVFFVALFIGTSLFGAVPKAEAFPGGTYTWTGPLTLTNTDGGTTTTYTCVGVPADAPTVTNCDAPIPTTGPPCPNRVTFSTSPTSGSLVSGARVGAGCSYFALNQTVTVGPSPLTAGLAPGWLTTPGGAAGSSGTTESDPSLSCGPNPLTWLLCPVIVGINGVTYFLDNLINNMLEVDQKKIFNMNCTTNADGCEAAKSYHLAWQTFRGFSLAILLIAGLFMVIAQGLGFEVLDAYAIKKIVPRLIIAIIGISLSWEIAKFFVIFTNDFGLSIRSMIYYPFKGFNQDLQLGGGSSVILTLLGGGALFALTVFGIFSFALTAALAIGIAFLVLIIRQIIVVMLILFAPIAIACSVLPNTQGVYKLWYESFTKALMMFPIIVAFLAIGRVFAVTTIGADITNASAISQIIGLAAYIMPYFLIPLTFKFAGGAMRGLGGMVNDRGRGAFDRLKKGRQAGMKRKHEDRMAQKTAFGSSKAGGLYRRAALAGTPNSGALSFTKKGRAKYLATNQGINKRLVDETLKHDDGRAAGDDLATKLASQENMTSGRFMNDYVSQLRSDAAAKGEAFNETNATNQARGALATIESSFGARMGSNTMQGAAWKARAASVTGYDESDQGKEELFADAGRMVAKGLMTSTDAMTAIKQNKGRIDQSGISFGAGLGQIDRASRGEAITEKDINALMDSMLDGLTPGSLIGARKESAQAIARHSLRNLNETIDKAGGNIEADSVTRKIARASGIQDTINQQAPQMAQVFADNLMGQEVQGRDAAGNQKIISVRQRSDELRTQGASNVAFNDIRKEWLSGVPPNERGGMPPKSLNG